MACGRRSPARTRRCRSVFREDTEHRSRPAWSRRILLRGGHGPSVHATFPGLVHTAGISQPSDRFEQDTIDILKRVSRRPIEPTPQSELLADLGFDSLQVLEVVAELEDHFNIAVPLDDLSRIRTVAQVVAEVRDLARAERRPA